LYAPDRLWWIRFKDFLLDLYSALWLSTSWRNCFWPQETTDSGGESFDFAAWVRAKTSAVETFLYWSDISAGGKSLVCEDGGVMIEFVTPQRTHKSLFKSIPMADSGDSAFETSIQAHTLPVCVI